MKSVFYLLIVLFLSTNFTACTADSIADNSQESPEEVATTGAHGQVDPEEDEGGN